MKLKLFGFKFNIAGKVTGAVLAAVVLIFAVLAVACVAFYGWVLMLLLGAFGVSWGFVKSCLVALGVLVLVGAARS